MSVKILNNMLLYLSTDKYFFDRHIVSYGCFHDNHIKTLFFGDAYEGSSLIAFSLHLKHGIRRQPK